MMASCCGIYVHAIKSGWHHLSIVGLPSVGKFHLRHRAVRGSEPSGLGMWLHTSIDAERSRKLPSMLPVTDFGIKSAYSYTIL